MGDGYTSLDLSTITPIAVAGVQWQPIRRTLGIQAFGINAYVGRAAGDHVVEEHTEEVLGHEEVYIVLAGHATFSLDGEELDAPQGTAVFIRDPAINRRAVAVEPGTTVLAVGGTPGAHSPSAWEWYFEAERYRENGDYAAALELLADGRERFPDNAGMAYATACWEAMAGRHEDAIASLSRAFELDPERTPGWAKGDEDLDSIRGLPGSPI